MADQVKNLSGLAVLTPRHQMNKTYSLIGGPDKIKKIFYLPGLARHACYPNLRGAGLHYRTEW